MFEGKNTAFSPNITIFVAKYKIYENRYYRMKNGLIREAYDGEIEELKLMIIATKEQIVIEFMRDKGWGNDLVLFKQILREYLNGNLELNVQTENLGSPKM